MPLKLWRVFGRQSFKLVIQGLTVRCRTTDWTDCQRPKITQCIEGSSQKQFTRLISVTGQEIRRLGGKQPETELNISGRTIKENVQTYNSWSKSKPRDIEENLNSEHLVKNNLHVSLHLYSAQSFKKLNFSQHVPFKNSSGFRLEEPTPQFSHSGPSDCLTSFKSKKNNTTVQTHTASSPSPHALEHGTVQWRALSHGPARSHLNKNHTKEKKTKNICDIKDTLTWDREPVLVLKHVVWTHSCCNGRRCSLHTEEELVHTSLRLRSSSTLFHTVHLKENNATKHKKRQN